MDKPRQTPEQFHQLPYSKKLDTVVKLYVTLCTSEDLFIGKRMNPCYFQLRRHFTKESPVVLQCFYDWLYTLDTKVQIDLTTAYQRVEQHKINLRMSANKPSAPVESYRSLLEHLKEM